MNLFRTLSGAALLLSIGAGLSSCLQAPDYPVEPRIEENALTVFRRIGPGGEARDSVEIALNFQDGDGDLGLSDTDTTGAFAYNQGRNRFNKNYFVDVFYRDKVTKEFVPLVPSDYNGRFTRLTDSNARPGPIKGVLRCALPFSLTSVGTPAGTELRFRVNIADRALHESNVVTTKSVIL